MRDSQLLPVPSSNFSQQEVEERCVAWQCFAFLWTSQVGSTAEAEWIQWWIGCSSKSVYFLWVFWSGENWKVVTGGFGWRPKMGQATLIVEKFRFLFQVSFELVGFSSSSGGETSEILPFHVGIDVPQKRHRKIRLRQQHKTQCQKNMDMLITSWNLLFGVPTTPFHFFSRQVLANFSALSTTPPIRIQKTELRGITIDQLLVPLPPEV